ncbi:hypothetical protein F5141DRAFT_1081833 [Pisolithus sp. B1]|nr:hypothetical protein F5141DRAFT_1081833 [Pisolithus sp. B1]
MVSPRHAHSVVEHASLSLTCRDERKKQVTAQTAARQKKKADNIAMRNERRNDKRKGKGKSKARPGFEGKSFAKGKGKSSGKK